MKLIASAAMLKEHLDLKRNGRIRAFAGDVAGALGNVRNAKARLALEGSPLLYRPAPPISNYNDPTPEWQRKAGQLLHKDPIGKGELIPAKRYRIKSILEAHGDKLDWDIRTAIERLLQDSDYANRVPVSDPNRGGGFSSPGARLGGLGNVPQHQRDGHARFEWVMPRLDSVLHETAGALVFRMRHKPDGTPFSMEEFGGYMFPMIKDANRRWGASAGLLKALGARLCVLYKVCPVKARVLDEAERRLELSQ